MPKRGKITIDNVSRLRPGQSLSDGLVPGFVARRQRDGVSFILLYRHGGRLRLHTIGKLGGITPEQARKEATKLRGKVAAGQDPAADKAEARREAMAKVGTAFDNLARQFIARMIKRGKWRSRTAAEVERIFEVYAIPAFRDRPIVEIKRSEVAKLLDKLEDRHGAVMADRVLAWVRRLFNWWAAQDDEFRSPIVRGMARISNPKSRARARVLDDDEIRAVWRACDKVESASFGKLIRLLLLTGQRRQDCAGIERAEVNGDLWIIAPERYKVATAGGHAVPLSDAARAIIDSLPEWKAFYFGQWGNAPFSGFSKCKAELDRLSGVTGWTIHDLRRTAKTLMQRAGVRPDISERVLGHVIEGVEGTYDRYNYLDEKRAALEKLAALIERIVAHKSADNVIELKPSRAT